MDSQPILDLSFLTPEEITTIQKVLDRDETMREAEEKRQQVIKQEIAVLRKKSAIKVGTSQKSRQCQRCHAELGLVLNKGVLCPKCHHLVCLSCRVDVNESQQFSWLCSLCFKQRLLPALTGDWFYNSLGDRYRHDVGALMGTQIVKSSINRAADMPCNKEQVNMSAAALGKLRSNPFTTLTDQSSGSNLTNLSKKTNNEYQMSLNGKRENGAEDLKANQSVVVASIRRIHKHSSSSEEGISSSDEELNSNEPVSRAQPCLSTSDQTTKERSRSLMLQPAPDSGEATRQRSQSAHSLSMETSSEPAEFTVEQLTQIKFRRCSNVKASDVHKLTVNSEKRDSPDGCSPGSSAGAISTDYTQNPLPLPAISVTNENNPRNSNVYLSDNDDVMERVQCHSSGEETEDIDDLFNTAKKIRQQNSGNLGTSSAYSASRESLASIYSEAGGHFGQREITGDIEFSMEFKKSSANLVITVKRCRNLAAINTKKHSSDAYVKTYLLPDKSKGSKRKTKVKKDTLDPVYNEVLRYNITEVELRKRTLQLSVWNFHRLGHSEFLGEVVIPFGSYRFEDHGSDPLWYPLNDRVSNSIDLSDHGDLHVALKYEPSKNVKKSKLSTLGDLHVKISAARNLTAKRAGTSDAFVKGYLLPNKKIKHKTQVRKNSLNPEWNETFVFEQVDSNELNEVAVELTVWDFDRLTSNDFLGGFVLGVGKGTSYGKEAAWMDSSGKEVELWEEMIRKPGHWVDDWLKLRPSMQS